MRVDTSGGISLVGGRYTAFAEAYFQDYIRFGSVRPASMVMTFQLDGVIDAHSAVISSISSSFASGGILVDAADVFYSPTFVGSFIRLRARRRRDHDATARRRQDDRAFRLPE